MGNASYQCNTNARSETPSIPSQRAKIRINSEQNHLNRYNSSNLHREANRRNTYPLKAKSVNDLKAEKRKRASFLSPYAKRRRLDAENFTVEPYVDDDCVIINPEKFLGADTAMSNTTIKSNLTFNLHPRIYELRRLQSEQTIDLTDDDDDDDDEPQSELRSVDPTDTPSTPYTGQLVWARFLKFPYWPAIVLSSDATQDEIHVKFFADKGRVGYVKKQNVFEFRGMNSYLEYKDEMKNKLNKTLWKSSFRNTKSKPWERAVIEAMYISTIDLNKRLTYFDIVLICSSSNSYASSSQSESVNNVYEENPNIFEDVTRELERLKSLYSPSDFSKNSKSTRLASVMPMEPPTSLTTNDKAQLDKITAGRQQTKNLNEKFELLSAKRTEFERNLKMYVRAAWRKNILFRSNRP